MSYKITRANEAYEYEAKGHFDVKTTRLCDPVDVDGGKLVIGLSHFEVGGGTVFGGNPLESVYYIVKGQMTLKTDDQETVLHEGDVFHCAGGQQKSVLNTGDCVCQMLVCLLPPQQ